MAHLITGGAGFIGCNLADYLLARGEQVTIVDNLSRPRTPLNLAWLQERYGNQLRFVQADIRDAAAMQAVIPGHQVVYHLAGQVAVTTSVQDPRSDFEINALGTLLSCNWKGPMMNFLPGAGRALPRAPGTPGFVPANQRAA